MAATQDNKPLTNEMRHEVFNRRYAALIESVAQTPTDAETQEAYDLMLELPPASERYKVLKEIFKEGGGYNIVKVHPADNSKEAKRIALREQKMPKSHHATRGKTFKATPRQLATGKVAALEAQVSAFHATVAEREAQVVAAKAELAAAEEKLKAARKAVKGTRAKTTDAHVTAAAELERAAFLQKQAKVAATPKGALSEAMKIALNIIKLGRDPEEANGSYSLEPKQFSAARMHLAMRKLVAKNAKGEYSLTAAGKTALKGLK